MKRALLFLKIIFLTALLSLSAQAEFFYEPTVIIIPAPGGKGNTFVKLSNPMGRPTTIFLSATEWEVADGNKMVNKKYDENDSNSILNYVKISPRQLTLAPKQEKIVRIACNLPASLENKEYKLTLNMLEPGSERKTIDTGDATREFGLKVNKQIKASTYIWKGQNQDLKSNLKITNFSVTKNKISQDALSMGLSVRYKLTYENSGNIHDRRTVGIRLFDADTGSLVQEISKVGILVAFPTKPEESINFESSFTLPPEVDSNKNYDVEFVLVPRFAYKVEALDPMTKRQLIKSEKLNIK